MTWETLHPRSALNEWLVPLKLQLADAKEALTEREWTTLMDILQRYTEHELDPDTARPWGQEIA